MRSPLQRGQPAQPAGIFRSRKSPWRSQVLGSVGKLKRAIGRHRRGSPAVRSVHARSPSWLKPGPGGVRGTVQPAHHERADATACLAVLRFRVEPGAHAQKLGVHIQFTVGGSPLGGLGLGHGVLGAVFQRERDDGRRSGRSGASRLAAGMLSGLSVGRLSVVCPNPGRSICPATGRSGAVDSDKGPSCGPVPVPDARAWPAGAEQDPGSGRPRSRSGRAAADDVQCRQFVQRRGDVLARHRATARPAGMRTSRPPVCRSLRSCAVPPAARAGSSAKGNAVMASYSEFGMRIWPARCGWDAAAGWGFRGITYLLVANRTRGPAPG